MSPEFCLNFVTQKFTKGASNGSLNGCHCQWQKDYRGDSWRSLVVNPVWRSVLRCDIQCTSILGAGPCPNILQRGPIRQSPNDYAATCHKVLNVTWSTIQRRLTVATCWWISGLVCLLTFEARNLSAVLTMAALHRLSALELLPSDVRFLVRNARKNRFQLGHR